MQRKAHPQVGCPNATQGTSASWAPQRTSTTQMQGTSARSQVGRPNAIPQHKCKAGPHVRKLGTPMQRKARPQVGCPNPTQGEFARWAPKRKTHPQRKRPHKGALGKKTTWRMDKNKFWLGGRIFNTASPRLGAPMQRKAPQCNARHVRKMGAQTKN
jgi:hypothetical protein